MSKILIVEDDEDIGAVLQRELEKDGMEVLIHIGVNTVNMQGEGFTAFVEDGAEVKAGQRLIGFDREAIAKAGYNDTVVMLLTNSDDLEGVECGLK